MRTARAGRERHVVALMNRGLRDEAIGYMKMHGIIQGFAGAPEWKPVSAPEKPMGLAKAEEYVYPDFKPVREPLPDGVVYARIKREMAHELQKVAELEEDGHLPPMQRRERLVWMSLREQKDAVNRKGRLVGQVFPIEVNPDDLQGGFRVWRR